MCLKKWRTTCKWIVIYSQYQPSVETFFFYSPKISTFLAILTQIYEYMLYVGNVFYAIKIEQFDLYNQQKKEEERSENMNRTCKFMYIFNAIQYAKLQPRMKCHVCNPVFNNFIMFRMAF